MGSSVLSDSEQEAAAIRTEPLVRMDRVTRRPRISTHWLLLIASVAVILTARVMEVRPDQRVGVAGYLQLPVPPLCASRTLLGIPCPACGLTRSFIHLAHGRWQAAFDVHRLGWLIFLLAAAQIPYRAACLWYRRALLPPAWASGIGTALALLMAANWVALWMPS